MDSEEPPNVRVAERGVAGFYVGPVADHINRAVGAAGGALRCEDLHLHRTDFEPTIETTYRGWRIHQTGLPSQGMILLEALNIAECEPASHLAEINAHAVHMSAELLKLAYADRLAYACDPKFAPTPLDSLLSKTWARRRYEAIDRLRASETAMAGALADGDTTYLCAADGEGGMVSLIQSVSSAFGSGLVAGGTGVLLNNRVGRGFSLIEGDAMRSTWTCACGPAAERRSAAGTMVYLRGMVCCPIEYLKLSALRSFPFQRCPFGA